MGSVAQLMEQVSGNGLRHCHNLAKYSLYHSFHHLLFDKTVSELYRILQNLRGNRIKRKSGAFTFYETSLIVNCFLFPRGTSIVQNVSYEFDVFLGGACNPTSWRIDTAIPFLEAHSITYYNPQGVDWCPDLIDVEAKAKSSSRVLLFVFETWRTRAVSSFIEVSFLAARKCNLVLVFSDISGGQLPVINGEQVSKTEYICLLQAKAHLLDLARHRGIPLFFSLTEALPFVKELVMQHQKEEQLRQHLSSLPEDERILIDEVSSVCKVFQSLPQCAPGFVSPENEKIGLHRLDADLPCRELPWGHTSSAIDFPQFCLHYGSYIRQHRASRFKLQSAPVTTHQNRHVIPSWMARLSLLDSLDKKAKVLAESYFSWSHSFSFSDPSSSEFVPTSCTSNSSLQNALLAAEPPCSQTIDVYLNVSDFNSYPLRASSFLHQVETYLRRSNPNIRTNLNFHRVGASRISLEERGPFGQWLRAHSRLLLFYVTATSLDVTQMLEAAYCIGLGFNVVLCVELMHSQTDWVGSATAASSTSSSPITSKYITVGRPTHGSSINFPPSDSEQLATVRQISCPSDVKLGLSSTPIDRLFSRRCNERCPTSPLTSVTRSVRPATSVDSGFGSLPSPVGNPRGTCFKDPDHQFNYPVDTRLCRDKRPTPPHSDSEWCSHSPFAVKDHNRGRTYLTSIGNEMHIPITDTFTEALVLCESVLARPS
ncbi:unnamed protein product [Dicrocoelium dendriticum]|nr:unnamed protein product [Dicrocoelium dendriticum]